MKAYKSFDRALTRIMSRISDYMGRPFVFLMMLLLIAAWFAAKPFLDYEAWFDIMDIFIFLTTFTFLFIIQSSQNADTKAMQDKLDDIIAALPKTHNSKRGEEKRIKDGTLKNR